jgi:hypothetical protein
MGAALGWFMTQIFAKDARLKTALKWLFGVTVAGALIVAFWPTVAPPELPPSAPESTTGSHSPILHASNITYTDTTINQAASDPLKQQLQQLCQDLNEFAVEADHCGTNDSNLLVLPSGKQLDVVWWNRYIPTIRELMSQLRLRAIKSKLQDGVGVAERPQYIRDVAAEICRLSKEVADSK